MNFKNWICLFLPMCLYWGAMTPAHADFQKLWDTWESIKVDPNSSDGEALLESIGFHPTKIQPKRVSKRKKKKEDRLYQIESPDGAKHTYGMTDNLAQIVLAASKVYGRVLSFRSNQKKLWDQDSDFVVSVKDLDLQFLSFAPEYIDEQSDLSQKSSRRTYGWKTTIDQIENSSGFRLIGYLSNKSGQDKETYLDNFIVYRFQHRTTKDIVETAFPDRLKEALEHDPFATLMNQENANATGDLENIGWEFKGAYLAKGRKTYEYIEPNGATLQSRRSPQEIVRWHFQNGFVPKADKFFIVTDLCPADILALQLLYYNKAHKIQLIVVTGPKAQQKANKLKKALSELSLSSIKVEAIGNLDNKGMTQLQQLASTSTAQVLLPLIGLDKIADPSFLKYFSTFYDLGYWQETNKGNLEPAESWIASFSKIKSFLKALNEKQKAVELPLNRHLNLAPLPLVKTRLDGLTFSESPLKQDLMDELDQGTQPLIALLREIYPKKNHNKELSNSSWAPLIQAAMALELESVVRRSYDSYQPYRLTFEPPSGDSPIPINDITSILTLMDYFSKKSLEQAIARALRYTRRLYYKPLLCKNSLANTKVK